MPLIRPGSHRTSLGALLLACIIAGCDTASEDEGVVPQMLHKGNGVLEWAKPSPTQALVLLQIMEDDDNFPALFTLPSGGTRLVQITHKPPEFGGSRYMFDLAEMSTKFSPDGAWIVYTASWLDEANGNQEVYLFRTDGSEQRSVASHEAIDISGAFSLDGELVVFTSNRSSIPSADPLELYAISSSGGEPWRLIDAESVMAGAHSVRAFADGVTANNEVVYHFDVYEGVRMVGLDGSNNRLVIENAQPRIVSQDGRKLVYRTLEGHTYFSNADGTAARLVSADIRDQPRALSSDGRKLAMHRNLSSVYSVDTETLEVTSIRDGDSPYWVGGFFSDGKRLLLYTSSLSEFADQSTYQLLVATLP